MNSWNRWISIVNDFVRCQASFGLKGSFMRKAEFEVDHSLFLGGHPNKKESGDVFLLIEFRNLLYIV